MVNHGDFVHEDKIKTSIIIFGFKTNIIYSTNNKI